MKTTTKAWLSQKKTISKEKETKISTRGSVSSWTSWDKRGGVRETHHAFNQSELPGGDDGDDGDGGDGEEDGNDDGNGDDDDSGGNHHAFF